MYDPEPPMCGWECFTEEPLALAYRTLTSMGIPTGPAHSKPVVEYGVPLNFSEFAEAVRTDWMAGNYAALVQECEALEVEDDGIHAIGWWFSEPTSRYVKMCAALRLYDHYEPTFKEFNDWGAHAHVLVCRFFMDFERHLREIFTYWEAKGHGRRAK